MIEGVVGDNLVVYGTSNLRVVDARCVCPVDDVDHKLKPWTFYQRNSPASYDTSSAGRARNRREGVFSLPFMSRM